MKRKYSHDVAAQRVQCVDHSASRGADAERRKSEIVSTERRMSAFTRVVGVNSKKKMQKEESQETSSGGTTTCRANQVQLQREKFKSHTWVKRVSPPYAEGSLHMSNECASFHLLESVV